MSASDPLLDGVRALVERVAGPSRIAAAARPGDAALREEGFWLDSVELLEVVVACEAEFGITFDAMRDLAREALETLGSLTELIRVEARRASAPGR